MSLGGGSMRRIVDFLFALPETCSRMSYQELLVTATFLTLALWLILMVSGRKLAQ
jgi:hypothetical protein